MKIGIVNYGCGNIASISNIIKYIGYKPEIINRSEDVLLFDSIILPGVGHFKNGMSNINFSGMRNALDKRAELDKPILGICLGMQLMTQSSEESDETGLCWFDSKTIKFTELENNKNKILVPHMGWNYVKEVEENVFFEEEDRFYFVHSFYVDALKSQEALATTIYEEINFSSAIKKGNLVGVQFHPEKSHQFGMTFFRKYFNKI
ncbi:hypothetical protein LH51_01300 [Nitrincola sp. A-D6]|nr:hypothetical protein LH51_01300 [Nitrincola sp. A-D6]